MNAWTLNFFDPSLEFQYRKEIQRQRMIKFTRFMILKNFFILVLQTYQLITDFHLWLLPVLILSLSLTLLILLLKQRVSPFLYPVLILNYLGLIVSYVESLKWYIHDTQFKQDQAISLALIIPYQVMHSMMIYTKCKWFHASIFFFCSLIYLFFRVFYQFNFAIPPLVIMNFCASWILHSFIAYDQEKTFKKFFKNMVDNYEKVNYFKLILKNVIPSPIFIVDYDKSEIKFTNNSGNHIINKNQTEASFLDFEKFLRKFSVLQENPEISSNSNSSKTIPEELSSIFNNYFKDLKMHPFLTNIRNEQDVEQCFLRMNIWTSSDLSEKTDDHGILFQNQNSASNPPSKIYYEIKIIKLYWEGSVCLLLLFNDITSVFRISDLLNLDLYKNQLLASVSHDLRTPLNGLNGMIELSMNKCENKEIKSYLDMAKKSGFFLNYLINDILDFSLMNFKKMRLNIEEVDLLQIIEHMMGLIEFQAKERKIELKFQNFCKKLLPINSDSTRIKQILINLLSNAMKFTQKGSISIILEDFTEHSDLPVYKISVKDTGIGIKPEDINKLYTLFGRLDDQGKLNKKGIGLGLTISKKMSILLCPERPEGLQVESVYGKGSTFFFFLTSLMKNEVPKDESEYMDEKASGVLLLPSLSQPTRFFDERENFMINHPHEILSKTVLIVDDDLMNLMIAEQYLKLFKFNSLRALNGKEACNAIKKDLKKGNPEISMIIMDCNMPIMDGFQASMKIRKYYEKKGKRKIPIMGVTANTSNADILMCKSAGMDHYMEKPLRKLELKKALENIFDIKING